MNTKLPASAPHVGKVVFTSTVYKSSGHPQFVTGSTGRLLNSAGMFFSTKATESLRNMRL
eukprot:6471214-Amphidinium_carterae.1